MEEKYPKDWCKYLKKGDVVKCIKNTYVRNINRIVERKYTIIKDSNKIEIHYEEGCVAHLYHQDFIPISMEAFPNLNKTESYEIF